MNGIFEISEHTMEHLRTWHMNGIFGISEDTMGHLRTQRRLCIERTLLLTIKRDIESFDNTMDTIEHIS